MKSDDKELNTFVSETTVYQKLWIAVSFIHSQAFVIYQKKKKKKGRRVYNLKLCICSAGGQYEKHWNHLCKQL